MGCDKKVSEHPTSSTTITTTTTASSSGGPILHYSHTLRHVLDDVRGTLDITTNTPDGGNNTPFHAPSPDTSQHNIENVSLVLTLTSIEVCTFYLTPNPLNHASFRISASSSSLSSSSITISCRIPTAVYIREQVHPLPNHPIDTCHPPTTAIPAYPPFSRTPSQI